MKYKKSLKFCQDELIFSLLDIINTSIIQKTVPKAMKSAIIFPKFKKGCTKQKQKGIIDQSQYLNLIKVP